MTAYYTNPIRQTEIYDLTFVYFLTIEVIGKEDILSNKINPRKVEFAREMFKNRIKDDLVSGSTRLQKFETFVSQKVVDIKQKYKFMEPNKKSVIEQLKRGN